VTGILARVRARVSDAASLRSWTVEANDGIIATAGVLEGFAGAGGDDATLITVAVAVTIAGALGLGGAKWAEEEAEREAQLRVVAQERALLASHPDDEVAELAAYYEHKGLRAETARQVAEQLSARDALAAQLETEYGIDEIMPRSQPVWTGVQAALAFAVGALIPLLITVFVPVAIETWAILGAVVVSLVVTSTVTARVGGTAVWRTVVRTLAVGVGTLGISFVVGVLLL
jgi:VIT1/CCC1 family predicted Fe2+/Mn2+ transporter